MIMGLKHFVWNMGVKRTLSHKIRGLGLSPALFLMLVPALFGMGLPCIAQSVDNPSQENSAQSKDATSSATALLQWLSQPAASLVAPTEATTIEKTPPVKAYVGGIDLDASAQTDNAAPLIVEGSDSMTAPLAPSPQEQSIETDQSDAFSRADEEHLTEPADNVLSMTTANDGQNRDEHSDSSLFSVQRPFLLYAQDVAITYLMPNAVVNHAILARRLRDLLENRALTYWQEERGKQIEDDQSESATFVVKSRIEDLFASKRYISLLIKEERTREATSLPDRILTYNYDLEKQAPLTLEDLFKGNGKKDFSSIVDLLFTYIKADIVRQKTVRLGLKIAPDQDAWLSDFSPSLSKLQTFSLVPSTQTNEIAGLIFYFNPGQLGAESDGDYQVYVPAAIFADNLSETWSTLFAGEAIRVFSHKAKGFSSANIHLEGLDDGAELGGEVVIEGEVPANWCNGFHLALTDMGKIVSEGVVDLLPGIPTFGVSDNMLRFRASLSVSGDGGKEGKLVFEPYESRLADVATSPAKDNEEACLSVNPHSSPDPDRDAVSINITF